MLRIHSILCKSPNLLNEMFKKCLKTFKNALNSIKYLFHSLKKIVSEKHSIPKIIWQNKQKRCTVNSRIISTFQENGENDYINWTQQTQQLSVSLTKVIIKELLPLPHKICSLQNICGNVLPSLNIWNKCRNNHCWKKTTIKSKRLWTGGKKEALPENKV